LRTTGLEKQEDKIRGDEEDKAIGIMRTRGMEDSGG
jgi:hypothetical protein